MLSADAFSAFEDAGLNDDKVSSVFEILSYRIPPLSKSSKENIEKELFQFQTESSADFLK